MCSQPSGETTEGEARAVWQAAQPVQPEVQAELKTDAAILAAWGN